MRKNTPPWYGLSGYERERERERKRERERGGERERERESFNTWSDASIEQRIRTGPMMVACQWKTVWEERAL